MKEDNTFAKDVSTELIHLENQLFKAMNLQQSFIAMVFELLQEKMPFSHRKEFDDWSNTITKLQKPFKRRT